MLLQLYLEQETKKYLLKESTVTCLAVILQTQWTDNFSEREFLCFYNMKYELTPFGMYFVKTQLHTNEKTSPSYRIRLL